MTNNDAKHVMLCTKTKASCQMLSGRIAERATALTKTKKLNDVLHVRNGHMTKSHQWRAATHTASGTHVPDAGRVDVCVGVRDCGMRFNKICEYFSLVVFSLDYIVCETSRFVFTAPI